MSADEIRFPPFEKRERRQFEVPPWERDQFEDLQRRRESERPPEPAEGPEAAVAPASTELPVAEERMPGPDATWADGAEGAFSDSEAVGQPGKVAADDAQLTAMLAELAGQEESSDKAVGIVSIASGALLVVIGCVLVVWGVAAFVAAKRVGAVGTFGGMVLLLFGAGFVGGGAWLGTKHLR